MRFADWLEKHVGPPTPGKLMTVALIPCGLIVLYVLSTEEPSHAQQPQVFGEKRVDRDLGSCTLIFPTGDLTKVLLQLSNNKILLDAKEYLMELRPGDQPIVAVKVYRGVYRPSAPVSKSWRVGEIKFVEMDIFQKLIDDAIESQDSTSAADAEADPIEVTKKTKIGVPILPSVPLNPNVPPALQQNTAKGPG